MEKIRLSNFDHIGGEFEPWLSFSKAVKEASREQLDELIAHALDESDEDESSRAVTIEAFSVQHAETDPENTKKILFAGLKSKYEQVQFSALASLTSALNLKDLGEVLQTVVWLQNNSPFPDVVRAAPYTVDTICRWLLEYDRNSSQK